MYNSIYWHSDEEIQGALNDFVKLFLYSVDDWIKLLNFLNWTFWLYIVCRLVGERSDFAVSTPNRHTSKTNCHKYETIAPWSYSRTLHYWFTIELKCVIRYRFFTRMCLSNAPQFPVATFKFSMACRHSWTLSCISFNCLHGSIVNCGSSNNVWSKLPSKNMCVSIPRNQNFIRAVVVFSSRRQIGRAAKLLILTRISCTSSIC